LEVEVLSYALKRGVVALLTILLVATITFFLMNAVPGSPFLTEKSTPDQIAKAEARYGLDKPLIVQFKNYLLNFMKGDLGVSLKMQQDTPVKIIIFEHSTSFAFVFSLIRTHYAIITHICFLSKYSK
jgi:oligopeptide transport system permease protein